VKLELLELTQNLVLDYIPESISCLQNLEVLILEDTSITQVPAGLATLQSLEGLTIRGCKAMQLPPSLEVRTLKVVTH
jgi:Leucine-rich repeat (LRR) protein